MNVAVSDPAYAKALQLARKGYSRTAIKGVVGRFVPDDALLALIHEAEREHELEQEERRAAEQRELLRQEAEKAKALGPFPNPTKLFREIDIRTTSGTITMASIIDRLCREAGVSKRELASASRVQRLAFLRQEAMYEAASKTSLATTTIGRMLGGRDHTTVIHGIRAHCDRHGLPLPRGMKPYERGERG